MGRNKFSQREIDTIRKLLSRKMSGTRYQQKVVRHELRTKFEFNISDFGHQGEAFGPAQLDVCINHGIIQILDEGTIHDMKLKRARLQMSFRPATANDIYFIAQGFYMAMHKKGTAEEQTSFAENICSADNVLYSPANTLICEYHGEVAGMLTAYDGQYYKSMRERTMALVEKYLGITFSDMDDETQEGEYYIDTLAVWPKHRGIGMGKALLERGIAEGLRRNLNVTLTVAPQNTRAQKLYTSLGFVHEGNLHIFGDTYWRMIYHKQ